jgi:HEAT repeat protein/lysophospholipase L1-like esterase
MREEANVSRSAGTRRVVSLAGNLALSLVVTLVTLAALEWLARRFEHKEPLPEDSRLVLLGPDKLTQLGSRDEPWPPGEHPFNGDGIRDRVHAIEKPARTWRLVILGDSVTFGHRLKPDDAYPQVLQRKLDARGVRVEVFNVALPGWATPQDRMAYERIARKYKPDQVLVGVCLNDILEMQNTQRRPPAPWLLTLYQRSALVRRVVGAPAREIRLVEQLCTGPDRPAVREGIERFFAEVRRLRGEVEGDGGRFGLLIFPFLFQLEDGAPPPRIQQIIAEFAKREGIPSLDLLPAIRAAGPAAFVDHSHFSAVGTEIVAEQVIVSDLLPARPNAPALLEARLARPDRSPQALASALRSREADVRWAAAWALMQASTPNARSVAALGSALNDEDDVVRETAARALSTQGRLALPAVPVLLARLSDSAAAVRWQAAEALWASGPPAANELPALSGLLHQEDPYIAAFAAHSLARAGAVALPLLLKTLAERDISDSALDQTLIALKAMTLSDPDVVVALTRTLEAKEPRLRARAAQALGRIVTGAASAQPALERLRDDSDPEVRRQAQRALRRVSLRPSATRAD